MGDDNVCIEGGAIFNCRGASEGQTANCPCPVTGEATSGTITIGGADTYYAGNMNCVYYLDTQSLLHMSLTSFATGEGGLGWTQQFVEYNYDFLNLYKVEVDANGVQTRSQEYGEHRDAEAKSGEGYITWTPMSKNLLEENVFKDSSDKARTGRWEVVFTSDSSSNRKGFELLWWSGAPV